jgi:glycosyltransferase involved in cell wall biosynthesis
VPLLSLIVPHHNQQRSLPRLLESVLAQSFRDLEVILADDHSDGPVKPIVEAYRSRGLDIVLLEHGERIYTMRARLEGIRASGGEIIGFADADDLLWGTEALEKNVEMFLREKPDILHFRSALIRADGTFLDFNLKADPCAAFLEGPEIFRAHVSSPYFFSVSSLWNKLFTREISLAVRAAAGNSRVLRYTEDGHMLLLYAFLAGKYLGSPHVGYGHYYEDGKKYAQAHERAAYHYHSLRELLPWLRERGCPEADVARCEEALLERLCVCAGQMSLAVRQSADTDIPDAIVERLLEHVDAFTLLKALLLGNALNARKILDWRKQGGGFSMEAGKHES